MTKRVKRVITTTIITVIIILTISLLNTLESRYTRDVTVKSVEETTITVEDNKGYVWEFNGDDYKVGQHIIVVMNDNHTSNIYDDEIIEVKE